MEVHKESGGAEGSRLDRIAAWMQVRPGFLVILAVWIFVIATAIRAQHRAFWYDELLTIYICRLPSFGDVWDALRAGLDLNPPLQYVAVRATQAIFGEGQLPARLPAMLSVLAMSLFLFAYLRRRVHAGWALTAMIFPWLTEAYRWAMEARPYAIVLGASGAALYFWSRATESGRRVWVLVGLALSITIALASHCYGILLAIPLVAGEAVRLWARRSADWLLWIVMAIGAWPVVMYPALMAANPAPPVQKSSPFHVSAWTVPETYQELLQPAFWLLAVLFTISLAGKRVRVDDLDATPSHELASLIAFAATPVFAVVLAALTTGAYSLRYGLPGVIGMAALLAWGGSRTAANAARSGALSAILLLAVFAGDFARQLWSNIHPSQVASAETKPPDAPSAPRERIDVPGNPLLSLASGSNMPVVIASGMIFLNVDYYGTEALRARSYYLMDPEAALRRTGSSWFDTTYPTAKRLLHLRGNLEPADQFLAREPRFLVYSTGFVVEWLVPELIARRWHLRLLGNNGPMVMLEATR